MWISKHWLKYAGVCALLALGSVACGLAEGDEDERKRTDYITLSDPAFEAFCLAYYDLNGDHRLSRYEAERVRVMDCSGRGIRSLAEIDAFCNLQELECSANELTHLDLERNRSLTELCCAENRLVELSVVGVRSLKRLDCHANALPRLDLTTAANLQQLDARSNALATIDLSLCARSLTASLRGNPKLTTIYARAGQQVDYESPAVLVER